jgi:hypothetical protein
MSRPMGSKNQGPLDWEYCRFCDARAVIKRDGTLRTHGPRDARCEGSGQPSQLKGEAA